MREWISTLRVAPEGVLLLVTGETGDLLKARLPLTPKPPSGVADAAGRAGLVAGQGPPCCHFCGRSLPGMGRLGLVRRRAVSRRKSAGAVSRRSPRLPRAPAWRG
jgi:hypothetical protein